MQDPGKGLEGLTSSQRGYMDAMQQDTPAQPQAGVASAPAAASGRGLGRAAGPASLSSAAARLAELQLPAPPTLRAPATPGAWSRSPWSHGASRYGPSQVVPAPSEEEQHPDSSRPLPAAQQRQQSAQQTPSLAKSVFSRVAVIGNRRLLAEQQQQWAAGSAAGQEQQQSAHPAPSLASSVFARVVVIGNKRLLPEQQQQGVAGSAAGQDELEAGPLGASACVVPSQPQLEDPERSRSPREAGMAAATGNEGGDRPGSATLMPRGGR